MSFYINTVSQKSGYNVRVHLRRVSLEDRIPKIAKLRWQGFFRGQFLVICKFIFRFVYFGKSLRFFFGGGSTDFPAFIYFCWILGTKKTLNFAGGWFFGPFSKATSAYKNTNLPRRVFFKCIKRLRWRPKPSAGTLGLPWLQVGFIRIK